MKKIRLLVENPFFTFMLVIVFVSSSFTQKEAIKRQSEFNLNKVNSKELFKGIIFNNGKVASLIPQLNAKAENLNKFDAATIQRMHNLENSVVSSIENENPAYFDEFKNAILTKNHNIIKEKLLESSKLVNDKISVYANLTEVEKDKLDEIMQKVNQSSIVDEKGNINHSEIQKFENSLSAVRPPDVLLAIVLVAVAVAVYAWVYFWGATSSPNNTNLSNSNSLELDQIVNNIVKL